MSADPPSGLPSVGHHAEESLQFIRQTLERSATFTAVPGLGGAAMGVIGLATAWIAAREPEPARWLAAWLIAAAVASSVGLAAVWRKAVRLRVPLVGIVARRFVLSLAAPFVAGAALTLGAWRHGDWALMPGAWLLLYGVGVVAAGVLSVAAVRYLGLALMAVGIVALISPWTWANVWLGFGFGGLQLAFGLYIAKKHGG